MSIDANFHYSLEAVQYRLAGMSNDERGYLLSGDEQYSSELLVKMVGISSSYSNPSQDWTLPFLKS
jgi:hypothetical protein